MAESRRADRMVSITGKIIKGIAGFYYVHDGRDTVYECKAKGAFRSEGIKPLPGDIAELDVTDAETHTGNIVRLLPRKNSLIRPASANVDSALLVFSVKDPLPSFNLIDRLLIGYDRLGIPASVAFSKTDLDGDESLCREYLDIYRDSGVRVAFFSTRQERGIDELLDLLDGHTTVITGPSGAGKSSLINRLAPGAGMEVGELSRKLGRGRNTTRHTELFCIGENTFILDTPGFTSYQLDGADKDSLKYYYREFDAYRGKCRFDDCVHIGETSCAVKDAVSEGRISRVRYDNYRLIYGELDAARKY